MTQLFTWALKATLSTFVIYAITRIQVPGSLLILRKAKKLGSYTISGLALIALARICDEPIKET
jgi:hypothetical protein